jgi:hypothetical protein
MMFLIRRSRVTGKYDVGIVYSLVGSRRKIDRGKVSSHSLIDLESIPSLREFLGYEYLDDSIY